MKKKDPYDFINDGTGLRKTVPASVTPVATKPSVPNTPNVVVSKETREGLEALSEALKGQRDEEIRKSEEAKGKVAGEVTTNEDVVKVDLGEAPEGAAASLGYQTVFYRNTPLDNPHLREKIEDECSPLSFSELILEGSVSQRVPVIPGKITAVYRSLKASDNMWLERQAASAENEYERVDWIGYGRLVLALEEFNNSALPDTKNSAGHYTLEDYKKKRDKIMELPEKVMEILLINLGWFEDRVGQLFANDFEQLKNG